MKHFRIGFCAVLMALSLAPVSWAGFEEGQALYDQGRYADAAREFEAVVRTNPEQANAHYRLGLTYDHLQRFREAVRSYETALKLDPSLGSTTALNGFLAQARAKALEGGAPAPATEEAAEQSAPPAATATPPALLDDSRLVRNLLSVPLYVDPAMMNVVSADEESELKQQLGDMDVTVRALVLPRETAHQYAKSVASLAASMHKQLRLEPADFVIIVTESEIAAVGGDLDTEKMDELINDRHEDFKESPALGTMMLADSIARARPSSTFQTATYWTYIGGALGAVVLLLVVNALSQRRKMRQDLQLLIHQVASRLEQMEGNLRPDLEDAKARQATNLFNEATAIYQRAEMQAPTAKGRTEMRKLSVSLQSALNILGDVQKLQLGFPAAEVAQVQKPKTANLSQYAGPSPDVGRDNGCFFCARTIVDNDAGQLLALQRDGAHVNVLACNGCLQAYHNGSIPQVVGVRSGNKFTAWFDMSADEFQNSKTGVAFMDVFMLSDIFDRASAAAAADQPWLHDQDWLDKQLNKPTSGDSA